MQDKQVWDKAAALERLAHKEDLLETVKGMFLEATPDFITKLNTAIQTHDFEVISTQAHSFKGAAGNLGANQIAGLCTALEQAAQAQDIHQIQQLWAQFPNAYNDLLQAFDHHS